jgi:DNA-binding response OmpR family regulator
MPRIAIVEDRKIDSDSMKELILENVPGASVEQYFDRVSAEANVSDGQFDLVIVDIDLGGKSQDKYGGVSVLARLNGKPVTTLVVSGTPEENLRDVVLSLRAWDFLGKPFSGIAFVNLVKHALDWKPGSNNAVNKLTFEGRLPDGLALDQENCPGFKWKGKSVALTITHLRLVVALVRIPGKVVETNDLTGLLDTGAKKAVAVHINEIKKRFRDVDPNFDEIANDPGRGYYWKPEA